MAKPKGLKGSKRKTEETEHQEVVSTDKILDVDDDRHYIFSDTKELFKRAQSFLSQNETSQAISVLRGTVNELMRMIEQGHEAIESDEFVIILSISLLQLIIHDDEVEPSDIADYIMVVQDNMKTLCFSDNLPDREKIVEIGWMLLAIAEECNEDDVQEKALATSLLVFEHDLKQIESSASVVKVQSYKGCALCALTLANNLIDFIFKDDVEEINDHSLESSISYLNLADERIGSFIESVENISEKAEGYAIRCEIKLQLGNLCDEDETSLNANHIEAIKFYNKCKELDENVLPDALHESITELLSSE